jgi:acyl-CoA dehydrogenase
VAAALQAPGATRDRILGGVYIPPTADRPLGRLEHALVLCTAADAITRRLRDAVKDGRLPRSAGAQLVRQGVEAGIISADEAEQIERAEAARADAIAVDSFTLEEFFQSAVAPESVSGDGAVEGVEHGWQVGQT